MIDRRRFVQSCTAGTAVLVISNNTLAASLCQQRVPKSVASQLSAATFKSLLRSDFRCLGGPDGAVRLQLTDLWPGPAQAGIEQFSLRLRERDSPTAQLPEGLYRLQHPSLGSVVIHLSPSDTHTDGYITHFSLLA